MRKIIISSAILLALAACGKKDENKTTITTADGKTATITTDANNSENGSITFDTGDGKSKITFGSDAAKQGLPLGLPVYPGGEIKGAATGLGNDGGTGGMVTIMTSDPAAKVTEFYKAEALKRGMEIGFTAAGSEGTGSFMAKGKDGKTLMFTASPGEQGQTAAVIIAGGN